MPRSYSRLSDNAIRITDNRGKAEFYFVASLGDKVFFRKDSDGTDYTVSLATRRCDCKGGQYVGRCKHADCAAMMRERGEV